MKPAELTNTISENFSLMRKSERKVAKFILDNLAEVII